MAKSCDDGDIIKNAAEGATKGVLDWSKEQVLELVERFKNGSLAFVGNKYTISVVKEQLKTGEWDISSKYVTDKDFQMLIKMGLTLRRLEKDKKHEQLKDLREKIHSRYQAKGLHIAQFVQRKLFSAYLGIAISQIDSIDELKIKINDLLINMDKYVKFIQEKDNVNLLVDEIKTSIYANQPPTFMVISRYSATKVCDNVIKKLAPVIKDYSFERHDSDTKDRTYFLTKNEQERID